MWLRGQISDSICSNDSMLNSPRPASGSRACETLATPPPSQPPDSDTEGGPGPRSGHTPFLTRFWGEQPFLGRRKMGSDTLSVFTFNCVAVVKAQYGVQDAPGPRGGGQGPAPAASRPRPCRSPRPPPADPFCPSTHGNGGTVAALPATAGGT